MDSLNSNLLVFSLTSFPCSILLFHLCSNVIFILSFPYFIARNCWILSFQKNQFELCIIFKEFYYCYLLLLFYVYRFKNLFLKLDLEFSSTWDYFIFHSVYLSSVYYQFISRIQFQKFRISGHVYSSCCSIVVINLKNHPQH
jgi:hypothetical protein